MSIDRLTLNVGARYDYFNAEVPALSAPAGTWVPARTGEAVKNVPNWHDVSPRVAVTHDLSGNSGTDFVRAEGSGPIRTSKASSACRGEAAAHNARDEVSVALGAEGAAYRGEAATPVLQ